MEAEKKEYIFWDTTKLIWTDPLGKTALIVVGGIALLLVAGVILKAAAFTMHGFKDFRTASKR